MGPRAPGPEHGAQDLKPTARAQSFWSGTWSMGLPCSPLGLVPEAGMKAESWNHTRKGAAEEEMISEKSPKQAQLFWPQTLASSINE